MAYGAPKKSDFDRPLINPGELSASRRRKSVPETTILTLLVALLALAAVVGTLYFVGRSVQLSGENPPPSRQQAADGSQADDSRADGSQADGSQADGSDPRAGGAPEEERAQAAGAGQDGAGEAAGQPDTLTVEVSVQGTPSWLSILADGNLRYEQIAQPGFSQTFEAQREISIRTGNAGAVGVEVNGQALGKLGESGEVLTRKFTLKTAT